MPKRFVTIWFRYLKTDWFTLRRPTLASVPFVLASADHGRMVVTAANLLAQQKGVDIGMVIADARAIIPSLQVLDDKPELSNQLLKALAEWFIRFTPIVALDPPSGLILDVSGCTHLWGGEKQYLADIIARLKRSGYTARAAMADTIGASWAIARYGTDTLIIENGQQTIALLSLPPAALRLESEIVERLEKLGLRQLSQFIPMPRSALRRRFGEPLLKRLDQALGQEEEPLVPVQVPLPFQERLPCLEPIVTATGIEIALERLLDALCQRLKQEGKGIRTALLKCYRVDRKIEQVAIGTNRASNNTRHIFKLFEFKLPGIEPALGIELFILEAPKVEDVKAAQETLWENTGGLNDIGLAELLDRVAGKIGDNHIHRYLPDEHYWPERSCKPATDLQEKPASAWKTDRPRPLQLLTKPEPIEVTAPIPDYPPMLFRYKAKLHKIMKADGPERIEQEWWLQEGQHRDYYCVEDEEGHRYWLFRSGHYDATKSYQWFIHGFFA
ncbi:MAG: DNA polymerase Y family protein [Rhizobacter sp.]|nr:DNA polymerase Y family protein [Ferruginibacter sp.]